MQNHQDEHGVHHSMLGETHPHKDLTHGHTDTVIDKDCTGWMKDWINWLLEIPYEDSPLITNQINPFNKGYNSLRPSKADKETGIMHLAAPVYGSSGNTYSNNYQVVPLGDWHLFFSPYIIFNSKQEYPSLEEDELFNLAKRQVDSVYRLEVLLDGIGVECCRVPIEPKDNAVVKNLPDKNVLGINPGELENDEPIKIVADGYACFLKPLPPGLHILSFKAYSPTYSLDTQIQLNVRGRSKKPKEPIG
ncbi:MAG: hypothetical protein H0X03_07575 [Nitrosopumilus sp.]|nr:hypothetical protein [Nitrosopumilus sp.]